MAAVVLVGAILCSCGHPSQEQKDMEAALGRMPGVHRVSTEVERNFSAVVVLTEDASAEQTKAIIETFRDQATAATGLAKRRIDIEVRWGAGNSSFKAGRDGLAAAPDRAVQWHALSHAFPRDEVQWTYQWAEFCCDGFGPGDLVRKGYVGVGDISVEPENDHFRAVSETYHRVMREFPHLVDAEWQVGGWDRKAGSLSADNRYPTELELSVWHRLNDGQTLPYGVLLTTRQEGNFSWRPSVYVRLKSGGFDDVKLLAEKHLPIVAELGTPDIDYFVTTERLGSPGSYDRDKGLRVTIGECQYTDYPPSPAEQPFVDRYGKCS